jgi:hypothetical protein
MAVTEVGKKVERREFLKKFGIVAGGATAGLVALGSVEGFLRFPPPSADPSSKSAPSSDTTVSGSSVSTDAVMAYAYLFQPGQISVQRDANGNISVVSYGPLTITITRNADGSIGSVNSSIPSDSISQTKTIARNPDGSISSILVA